MNSKQLWKVIGKPFILLGAFCFVISLLLFIGSSGLFGFKIWLFSLNYFDFVGPLFFVGFIFLAIGTNASRVSKQSQVYQPYSRDTLNAPEYHGASSKSAEIFGRTRFILQEKTELKDTLCILDPTMTVLCYAKNQHSWKTPYVWDVPLPNREMRTTDIRFEGVDGVLLGEIHELPPDGMRVIKRWQIFNEKGELKGTAKQKPKLTGNDWLLESANGNEVITIVGNHKKHDFKIMTADSYRQTVASCSIVDKDSFGIDIMLTTFSPFLVMSFIVILELSTLSITTRRGWNKF